LARSVAAIENRLAEVVAVDVAFKKPVFLPGTVRYAARHDDAGWSFAVTNPKDGSPHLLGRATPA
jgi:acyl dehydratase